MSFSAFDSHIWGSTDVPVRLKLWHRCKSQPTTFKHLNQVLTRRPVEVLHAAPGSQTAALIYRPRMACLFESYPQFCIADLLICVIATCLVWYYESFLHITYIFFRNLQTVNSVLPKISVHIWRGIFIKALQSALSHRSPFTLFNHVYRRSLAWSVMVETTDEQFKAWCYFSWREMANDFPQFGLAIIVKAIFGWIHLPLVH